MIVLRILVAAFVLALATNASAQELTNLWSFTGGGNGALALPSAGLVQGSDGNFYGTTFLGGNTTFNYPNGFGTVFRITPDGVLTNIYSFSGYPNDGTYPIGPLVQGNDGNFYGVTQKGGDDNSNPGEGVGTLFRIDPNGVETNLHSFHFNVDAGPPNGGLVQGRDGSFYGTTFDIPNASFGTVFRITPSGIFTTLYSFTNSLDDGAAPSYWGLVQGSDGNFYGTTLGHKWFNSLSTGTVFRISPSGVLTTIHYFVTMNQGIRPNGGLVQGSDGNLYGTTEGGGNTNLNNGFGYGTVYRVSLTGNFTNLWSFSNTDGGYPSVGLIQGSDGNFYGTTTAGGAYSNGTLFRISSSGDFAVLQSITTGPGQSPGSGAFALVQGSDGNFYGTTYGGGSYNNGSVFRIWVPLNPPANQISGFQLIGTNVVFKIPSVAGETYQLQYTTDLTSGIWSNVNGLCVSNSIGALLTLTNFGGALLPQGFYRFDITP